MVMMVMYSFRKYLYTVIAHYGADCTMLEAKNDFDTHRKAQQTVSSVS